MCIRDSDSAGYCQSVFLYITNDTGEEEKLEKSGEWMRQKLMLPSAFFLIEEEKKNVVFTAKGMGHGLGMSQFAANEMAMDEMCIRDRTHALHREP